MRSSIVLVLLGTLAAVSVEAQAPSASPARLSALDTAAFRRAARYSESQRGDAMLVMVDGRVVFESYTGRRGGAHVPHVLHSGTKSFTGVLAIAAQQDDLLSLDEPVSQTITEWRGDPAKRRVTIRQLLSLTSGLEGGTFGRQPSYARAVQGKFSGAPGERFDYGPYPFQLFGELLKRKLAPRGESVNAYLHRRILDPIGLTVGTWEDADRGEPMLPAGAELTAREWAKFGELVRNGGAWQEKQLFPREAFAELFRGSGANPAYGLTWWLNAPVTPELKEEVKLLAVNMQGVHGIPGTEGMVLAAGALKQRLFVIPARSMVVVRFGTSGRRQWSDSTFLRLLLADPVAPTRSRPSAREGVVTILHTNDIHGTLSPFVVDTGDATSQTGDRGRPYQEYPRAGVIGGFARLAGVVEAIRAERGTTNVILVDAGDTFGDGLLANLTRGATTLHLMDALGYDFMTLGNHDFEYSAARTRELQAGVRFPMRAANAVVGATGEPFLDDPTTVRTVAGVRVGLLALTYHNTPQTGNADNTRELRFESGIQAARRWVPALRQRADVVVVVSHQGTTVDSLLAASVPGIDLIVGGHSHDRIPPRRIGGTWVVQALSDASALGEVTFSVREGRMTDVQGRVHELYADRHAESPRFVRLLDSLRAPYRDTLSAVVGTAAQRIGRQYKSESPIDRLAAELLRRHADADAAFLPGLGFGVTWQPGPVTREMLVAAFPHPTPVVRLTMTGAQILAVLEQSATNLRPEEAMDGVGGLVQTAGMRWTLDFTLPLGRRVREVTVGGAPLDLARRYRVVTNGGMLQGTHRYRAFAAGTDVVREPTPMVVVLEQAMRGAGPLKAPPAGDVAIRR